MKRFLYLFHRWAGISLCLLFALWFISGIFMMYVKFPHLTRTEQLAAAAPLDFSHAQWSPAQAAAQLKAEDFTQQGTSTTIVTRPPTSPLAATGIKQVRLAMIMGRPAYVFSSGAAQPVTVFADNGERLHSISPAAAAQVAAAFAPDRPVSFLRTVQSDQWSVSGQLNVHRPLHLLSLDDAAGTELYVSSVTGEVVRDSTRRERFWNYPGAVIHWIYPHSLRQYPLAWVWTVDCLAVAGTLLALSGLWVGVLRTRRPLPAPRTAGGRWRRWHYLAGLTFGVVTLTWIFSGWMSMNPGKINPPNSPSAAERQVFAGQPFSPAVFTEVPALPAGAVTAQLGLYDRQPLVLATMRDGTMKLAATSSTQRLRLPTTERLNALAPALIPGALLDEIRLLNGYDNYYYTRQPENGTTPLPILRIGFADAEHTWFHVDPATGQIINRSTATNRIFRHLYHGLHSLDWWWLWSRRPLWDIVVIAFSLGGLALSLSGAALGIRHLRH